MLTAVPTPAGAEFHCLVVEADPDANVLLRVLEPFVIHDVVPQRIAATSDEDVLHLVLVFSAEADLAERLRARLDVMVPVRRAVLDPLALPASAAA